MAGATAGADNRLPAGGNRAQLGTSGIDERNRRAHELLRDRDEGPSSVNKDANDIQSHLRPIENADSRMQGQQNPRNGAGDTGKKRSRDVNDEASVGEGQQGGDSENPSGGNIDKDQANESRRKGLRLRRPSPFARHDQAILEILGHSGTAPKKKDKVKNTKKTKKTKTRKVLSPAEVPETQERASSPMSPPPSPKYFGPKVSDKPQVRPLAQDTSMLPPDYVLQRKLPCSHWEDKDFVISDLGIGRFQDDGGGFIDGRRVVPVTIVGDGNQGVRPMILVVPRFQGWVSTRPLAPFLRSHMSSIHQEETAALIRDAVTRSHCPSNTIGVFPGHGVVTEENMNSWLWVHSVSILLNTLPHSVCSFSPLEGGYTAVCLLGKQDESVSEDKTFRASLQRFGLSGIPIRFQGG